MRASEWAQRWPRHCRACGGWGGVEYVERVPYGMGSAGMPAFDPCEALELTVCHRCGEHGMDEFGGGPCQACGWNFDDGLPEDRPA